MRMTGLRISIAVACALFGATFTGWPAEENLRAQIPKVDLALVLAIDCSFSVDANEFRLQMEGLGRAFMQAEIKKAIRAGPNGQIAVAAIQWSDETNQLVIVPWRVIASDADADALGQILAVMPRRLA